ncbi:unnamed protein product [Toxocara canis]|uniref:Chemotaxis protein n=1 Tax=Toxocara canis TaxID=6265 RepID=A0A183U8D0_TOXCA|nr:unnamed protein product [Toxocara canis]
MDVIETMTNVLRYADRIRKQRQHTANYVVSLESALDDANAAIDNAVVSLNEFMSIISDDFDVGLCSLEKNWKGTLKEIEKGWSFFVH